MKAHYEVAMIERNAISSPLKNTKQSHFLSFLIIPEALPKACANTKQRTVDNFIILCEK